MIRCKFECVSVTKRKSSVWDAEANAYSFVYDARFQAVSSGSEENKQFFASTPTGDLSVQTLREDTFLPGESYYLDFTLAPAK